MGGEVEKTIKEGNFAKELINNEIEKIASDDRKRRQDLIELIEVGVGKNGGNIIGDKLVIETVTVD